MTQVKYFRDSVKSLTSGGATWLLHIILLSLVAWIPIVGLMLFLGYAFVWATRTAWGMNTSPTYGPLDIGKKFTLGAKIFVPYIVWSIILGIIYFLVYFVINLIPFVGPLLSLPAQFISSVITALLFVVALRSAIYESVGAGFYVGHIFDLIQRDLKGFLKIALMNFWMTILLGIVIGIPIMVLVIGSVFTSASVSDPSAFQNPELIMSLFVTAITANVGAIIILGFIGAVLYYLISLITAQAIGLWMRQFYPQTWGAENQPAPINARNQVMQEYYQAEFEQDPQYAPTTHANTYEQTDYNVNQVSVENQEFIEDQELVESQDFVKNSEPREQLTEQIEEQPKEQAEKQTDFVDQEKNDGDQSKIS